MLDLEQTIQPRDDDAIIERIKEQMKSQFESIEAYEKFISQYGYPLWKDNRKYGGVFIIPFVRIDEKRVNSFYFISVSKHGELSFSFYDVDQTYETVAKAPSCDSPFAPLVVPMEVEEDVFGRSHMREVLYKDGGIMSKMPDNCPTVVAEPGVFVPVNSDCLETVDARIATDVVAASDEDPILEQTDVIVDQLGVCPTFCSSTTLFTSTVNNITNSISTPCFNDVELQAIISNIINDSCNASKYTTDSELVENVLLAIEAACSFIQVPVSCQAFNFECLEDIDDIECIASMSGRRINLVSIDLVNSLSCPMPVVFSVPGFYYGFEISTSQMANAAAAAYNQAWEEASWEFYDFTYGVVPGTTCQDIYEFFNEKIEEYFLYHISEQTGIYDWEEPNSPEAFKGESYFVDVTGYVVDVRKMTRGSATVCSD